jgi:hypothetical protein
MGHGTTVPGEFDIDLVIYSRGTFVRTNMKLHSYHSICHIMFDILLSLDISGREVLETESLFQKWLRKLHAFLKKKQGYSFKNMTKRSVQFRYKDKVDVDLLVSPYWNNKDEFYMFLRDDVPRDRRDE